MLSAINKIGIMLLLSVHLQVSTAASGDIDTAYGTSGFVITDFLSLTADKSMSVLVQPGGNVIVAGEILDYYTSPIYGTYVWNAGGLARYNTDGALDANFGTNGYTHTFDENWMVYDDYANFQNIEAMEQLADGKIITTGKCYYGDYQFLYCLARYNSDGSLDDSFGAYGIVFGPSDMVPATSNRNVLAIQEDGKILVGSTDQQWIGGELIHSFAVLRFNGDGTLDTAFGENGLSLVNFGTGLDLQLKVLTLQNDGKVIIAGSHRVNGIGQPIDMAITRLNTDGSLDTAFAGDGRFVDAFTTDTVREESIIHSIDVQADNKIVFAGHLIREGLNDQDYAIARLNGEGTYDTTFGANGIAIIDLGYRDSAKTIHVQPDNKLIVTGSSHDYPAFNYPATAVTRLNTDGSVDSAFGASGTRRIHLGDNGLTPVNSFLDAGGYLFVTGKETGGDTGFIHAKLILKDENNDGFAEPYVAIPDAQTRSVEGVAVSSLQETDAVTITGLPSGRSVPINIYQGEYSINGAAYISGISLVGNGDTIRVRHYAGATEGETVTTILVMGGYIRASNRSVIVGENPVFTFSSTTIDSSVKVEPESSTGSLNGIEILLLGWLMILFRRSQVHQL